jgi:segregation and condensation protein B
VTPPRRRQSTLPAGDLDELEPRLGLWRFAWLWLTRGDRPIEADEEAESIKLVASETAPSRKRRVTWREPPMPSRTAWRKRAFSWLSRSAPAALESKRRRVSKPPSPTLGFRARASAWLSRSAPAALETKRRRVAKAPPPTLGFRARASAWLARSTPAVAAEPKRRRVSKAPAAALGFRERAFAWLAPRSAVATRPAPEAAPEPKRKRIPIAVLRAFRKRAFTWLRRPRELPPEPEIIAPVAPVVEAPPAPPKRKRGAKAPPPPPPPPPDPVTIFRHRAFAWFDEGGATTPLTGVQHPGGDVARAHLRGVLEALVFASEHPLPAKELSRLAKAELRLVKALLAELVLEYHPRGFRLEEVAGGFLFRTSPAFAPFVREQVAKKPVRMSRAQIETLAIVAYRQPITRPEVDDVRGVDSGAVLKSLLERDFVRILGKKDEPGRPILYGTTGDFLEFFGLKSLGDLPTLREFTELNDESKRTYEREMGEEPPDEGPLEGGLMGGEGDIRRAPAEVVPPRPVTDYEDAIDGEDGAPAGESARAGNDVDVGDDVGRGEPVGNGEGASVEEEGGEAEGESVHVHEDAHGDGDAEDEDEDEEDEDEDEDDEEDDEDDDDDDDDDEDDDDEDEEDDDE